MGLAIQATRVFQENQDHRDILANGVALGFQGFVTFPCVIRPTTSGSIIAKDLTCDDRAVWARMILKQLPCVLRKRFTTCDLQKCVGTVDSFMTQCAAALGADMHSSAESN